MSIKRCLVLIWILILVLGPMGCVSIGVGAWQASPVALHTPQSLMVCDTLYFGLSTPAGEVSESQWQAFLRETITPRFPEGLTHWDAMGQWQDQRGLIHSERSKVLQLIHGELPKYDAPLKEIISKYKEAFHQESVLWIRSRAQVSF